MSKAFITGIDGFTGRYLARELHRAGYEVSGLVHNARSESIPGVHAIYACDLCDSARLASIIGDVRPDVVVHLAAIAFVAHGDVDAMYRTNVVGSRNLLEALAQSRLPMISVLLASSANVYGNATEGILDETTVPSPANDYAVSKLSMEYMANLYRDRLPIIIARPFNYTGVGQSESFLLPKIVNHVRRKATMIELGNLDIARDFSDVRTVVNYYRLLLEAPSARGKTFNICSGKAYTLQEVLDMVRSLSRHSFEVRVNPAFIRQNEVKKLIGSRAKLETVIGSLPDIPLIDTLRDMLEAPASYG